MQNAHSHITLRNAVHDNPETVDIPYLRKGKILAAHGAVYAVQGFFAATDFGMYTVFFQGVADSRMYCFNEGAAVASRSSYGF